MVVDLGLDFLLLRIDRFEGCPCLLVTENNVVLSCHYDRDGSENGYQYSGEEPSARAEIEVVFNAL